MYVQVAQTTAELRGEAMRASEAPRNEDFDTLSNIVEYTRKHDALMSYYYMDEKGQVSGIALPLIHNADESDRDLRHRREGHTGAIVVRQWASVHLQSAPLAAQLHHVRLVRLGAHKDRVQ